MTTPKIIAPPAPPPPPTPEEIIEAQQEQLDELTVTVLMLSMQVTPL